MVSVIYCFDTSALNALHDDPDCEALTARLLATNTLQISALNVDEVCATSDASRARSLVGLLRRILGDRGPWKAPNLLLQELTLAFTRKETRVLLSVGPDTAPAYRAVLSGGLGLTEGFRAFIKRWHKDSEDVFRGVFEKARPAFQKLFKDGKAKTPRSRSALIRHYCKDEEFIQQYVGSIYKRLVGTHLTATGLHKLFCAVPSWVLYLGGWALSVYERDIQGTAYGAGRKGKSGKKPGTHDLQCAIYLPYCDRFITADPKQRRALRILNVFNPRNPRTKIISYEALKSGLLVPRH
jgi:hypothetical protein